jgi:RNA polymerase sigma factor (sigma-70 family)
MVGRPIAGCLADEGEEERTGGMTDGQLLECFVSRRDGAAFAALVQRHAPMVWGACCRILRNHHDAEDAFQATFLVLARRAASVTPREMVAGWLFGVARQTSLKARGTIVRNRIRDREVARRVEQTDPIENGWNDLEPLIDEELSRLPDRFRAVVVLCDLEGKTRKEAARQLGVPEGTVAGWLARARTILADRLTRRGVALSGATLAALMPQSVASASESVLASTSQAAVLYSAGPGAIPGVISPEVAGLAGKVTGMMAVSKLKIAAAALVSVALLGGIAGLTVSSEAQIQQAVSDPVIRAAVEPASHEEALAITSRTAGFKNLQKIGLTFHNYHDVFGQFPPAVLNGPDGKTPYSWRVELLPFLISPEKIQGNIGRAEYNELIAGCGYDVSQPWDSSKNRGMLEKIPAIYHHPNDKPDSVAAAFYAVVGSGTTFDPGEVAKYTDIKGWPASTLMVVESRSQEPWTKPIDIAYSKSATVPRFGGFTENGFLVLSADGAVHFVSDAVSPENLRAFLSKDTTDTFRIMGIPYRY